MATFARESVKGMEFSTVSQGILGPFLVLLSIYLCRVLSKDELDLPPSPHQSPIIANHCEEIDRLVGNTRLLSFDDMGRHPHANDRSKEVHQWRPLLPLDLPHFPTRYDEYTGYRIPEGALVLPDNWALKLDEEVFKDPTVFRPERWIETRTFLRLPLAMDGDCAHEYTYTLLNNRCLSLCLKFSGHMTPHMPMQTEDGGRWMSRIECKLASSAF